MIGQMVQIGVMGMVGRWGVEQLRKRFTGGGSSTQRDARPIVTGTLALILRLFGSGGIVHPYRCGLRMAIWLTVALAKDEPG